MSSQKLIKLADKLQHKYGFDTDQSKFFVEDFNKKMEDTKVILKKIWEKLHEDIKNNESPALINEGKKLLDKYKEEYLRYQTLRDNSLKDIEDQEGPETERNII